MNVSVINPVFSIFIFILLFSSSCEDSENPEETTSEQSDMPDVSETPEDPEVSIFNLEEGNYRGLWNSSTSTATFTNLAISAKIEESSTGMFEGEFFISDNFLSCCNSGPNDGTIRFRVSENTLEDFEWDDIIPNCNGTFEGNGELVDDNSFSIDITGLDCDGNHTGTIILSEM
ncbi:hypothetical protein [Croceitalea rosinachiae]|uniref:Lipocalin-like domain-containing protein n=1 Tax=Croceitalea rosinachiae TaxID=3075596 RepID=A0ABU3A5X2_9FLAO|nr:hypothetical protein [Croceitalea sp. F388]MDT0605572.1 hypothetical protein [Croceitalea sp. F388]